MQDAMIVPFEAKFLSDGPPGVFGGYGAVFGNEDSHGDVIAPGAFKTSLATIAAEGRSVPMYMQHGPMTGADPRPVGIWTSVAEDDRGLVMQGKLIGLDTEAGKYNYALVKEGAMRGLSIGYRTIKADYGKTNKDPRRTLKEVSLVEVSLVDQPSNPLAKVDGIKGVESIEAISTLREAEDYLRDAGGLSRTEAKSFLARLMSLGLRDADGGMQELIAALHRRGKALAA